LHGKPLIVYTIAAALRSRLIDRLIVSTDDVEIAEVARSNGADVPFLRPAELAGDTARAIGVVAHALKYMEQQDGCPYDPIVYLEPPAPLRAAEDIDAAIDLFLEKTPDSVVSVQEAAQYHPILMKKIVDGYLEPFCLKEPEGMPRQLYSPKAYMRNGAVYVLKRQNILAECFYGERIVPYIMPIERSVCIDDILDWKVAEAMLQANAAGLLAE